MLVAALTATAAATLFVGIVLALVGGRPAEDATDAVRACLVAAVVAGDPARRRAGAAHRRLVRPLVYGSEGPRRELLDQFAHGLGRATALDDVLQQLVETVRPACAADAAEVWLRRDGELRARPGEARAARRAGRRRRRRGPPPIGRAGVSGDGWAASWLPELCRGDEHLRIAPLAVQGELLGVLVARRGAGADDFDDVDDEGLARVVRLVAAALQNAELDAELRRTVDELRRSNADLRPSRSRLVTVADDERRRLERDLHDGAQSHLMGIAVKVQLARALLAADPAGRGGRADEIEHDVGDGQRPAALARPRHLPAAAAHRRAARRPRRDRRPRPRPRRGRAVSPATASTVRSRPPSTSAAPRRSRTRPSTPAPAPT